jgi:hypothetical protein
MESPLAYTPVPDKAGGFAGVLEDGTLIHVSPFGRLNAAPLAAVPFAIFPLETEVRQSGEGGDCSCLARNAAAFLRRFFLRGNLPLFRQRGVFCGP